MSKINKEATKGQQTTKNKQSDYTFGVEEGCTANVILIAEGMIYCCNTGDSRSVICDKGKAVELSKDHKPDLPLEKSRIITAGSSVIDGKVNGRLAVSRALGDWDFKNQK